MKVLCIFGTKCSLKWIQAPLGFLFRRVHHLCICTQKKNWCRI